MRLGDLSAKYESNGDAGCISNGYNDAGGKSYGAYQFASNCGVPTSFVRWLQNLTEPYDEYGNQLAQFEVGSDEFDTKWIELANVDPVGFENLQHNYVKDVYYDTAIYLLENAGFNIEKHSEVMKDVVWSRTVQYGTGNIVEMFETAVKSIGFPNLSYVDDIIFDVDIIRTIYLDVCSTPEWTNGSPALREGLYNRFKNECNDALNLL